MDYAALSTAQLQCVIGNNAAHGVHRAGYNGIFAMTAPAQPESPFVPLYAGWNLEHYFDRHPVTDDRNLFFEPRNAPMELAQIDENRVELYQPATPHYGVESWTEFALHAPHYIDVQYRCVPHRDVFKGGFLGVFWASYINAPLDKSIYFLAAGSTEDEPKWVQLCTPEHGHDSTVFHEDDTFAIDFEATERVLFASVSPLRYSVPFYYGRFRDMVLIYVFESSELVRFAHSPSGGGPTNDGTSTNPAWDFQLIVPEYSIGETYSLGCRVIYKPWIDRADVVAEVRKAREALRQG